MEASTFKPPKSIVFDHNAHQNLEKFLNSFDIYMAAAGLSTKDAPIKVAIFLNVAGEEAQDIFQTFKLTEEEKKSYEAVIEAFKKYCKPLKNETYDRFKFFTRIQEEGEDFDHFLTEVKILAKQCNFGTLEESLIRDKIVSGVRDVTLQERLLRIANLTLIMAEAQCRATEASKFQMKELRKEKEVDIIKYSKAGSSKTVNSAPYDCLKCGLKHGRKSCPAFGKICSYCNKPNHYAIGCKLKARGSNNPNQKQGNTGNKRCIKKSQSQKRVYEVNSQVDDRSVDSQSDSETYIDDIELDHDISVS